MAGRTYTLMYLEANPGKEEVLLSKSRGRDISDCVKGYHANDVWFNRLHALEEFSFNPPPESLSSTDRRGVELVIYDALYKIGKYDTDWRVADKALILCGNYELGRSFDEKKYVNLSSKLRDWAENGKATPGIIKGLKNIHKHPVHSWMYVPSVSPIEHRLADEMLRSYEKSGDFTLTSDYKNKKDQEQKRESLLSIKIKSKINYNPSDSFWDRENTLWKIAKEGSADPLVLEDLGQIAEKDSRLKDWALLMLNRGKETGNVRLKEAKFARDFRDIERVQSDKTLMKILKKFKH
jgi:hypothetical protein